MHGMDYMRNNPTLPTERHRFRIFFVVGKIFSSDCTYRQQCVVTGMHRQGVGQKEYRQAPFK